MCSFGTGIQLFLFDDVRPRSELRPFSGNMLTLQNGVLVSDPKGRDIKIDQYTLSYHGRLLIEGAEISLNYGNR